MFICYAVVGRDHHRRYIRNHHHHPRPQLAGSQQVSSNTLLHPTPLHFALPTAKEAPPAMSSSSLQQAMRTWLFSSLKTI